MKFVFWGFILALLVGSPALAQEFDTFTPPASSANQNGSPFVAYKPRKSAEALFDDIEHDGIQLRFLEALIRRSDAQGTYSSYAGSKRFLMTSPRVSVKLCEDVVGDAKFRVETYKSDRTFHNILTRKCYEDEYFLLVDGQPEVSLKCGNMLLFQSHQRELRRSEPARQVCERTQSTRIVGNNTTGVVVNSVGTYYGGAATTPLYATEQTLVCR